MQNSPRPALEAEYERLVREHYPFVHRFLFWLCGRGVLAEDLTQETFLRAWRGLAQRKKGAESDRAWLAAIARRTAIDHARGRELETVSLDRAAHLAHPSGSPLDHLTGEEHEQRLRSAVLALPEPYRTALVLTKIEELTVAEAARATGVPQGTVKWRVARGLRLLRDRLDRLETLNDTEREGTHDPQKAGFRLEPPRS